jgi:hypothetical protein
MQTGPDRQADSKAAGKIKESMLQIADQTSSSSCKCYECKVKCKHHCQNTWQASENRTKYSCLARHEGRLHLLMPHIEHKFRTLHMLLHSLHLQYRTMLLPAHKTDSARLAASVHAAASKRTTAQAAVAHCCQIDSPASSGHTTPDLIARFPSR